MQQQDSQIDIADRFLPDKAIDVIDEAGAYYSLKAAKSIVYDEKKEELKIPYNDKKELIDADICIVRKIDKKLVCVISVKKSFRERGGQTAYWAVKVKQHKKNYKYILATPEVKKIYPKV